MNECITKEEIKKLIYDIRDKKVMLVSDLAKVFECKNGTKEINQTLKRNKEKFMKNSYFQLTSEESLRCKSLFSKSQSVTLNGQKNNRGTNIKYLTYIFTREGIEVLSNILKSEKVRVISKIILEVYGEENNELSMSNSLCLREENIKSMIHNIRGKRVILDEDIAKLFQYETKMLNRQVLRNKDRFPENYCFQLTEEEYNNSLRYHFGTIKNGRGEHRKYLPYAFTEYGVIMLTSILKSKVADGQALK